MRGIYKITSKINNKVYIGETLDIKRRWMEHIEDLKKGNHHSKKLQNDWNQYGLSNFKFEIIATLDDDIKRYIDKHLLLIFEHKYINEYNSIEEGYNTEKTLAEILIGRKEDNVRISTLKYYISLVKNKFIINDNGIIKVEIYSIKDVEKELNIKRKELKSILVELKIIYGDEKYSIRELYFDNKNDILGRNYNTFRFNKKIYDHIIEKVKECESKVK